MTNPYFNHDQSRFEENTLARATQVNSVFDEIAAAFDSITLLLDGDLGFSEYVVATDGPNALTATLTVPPTAYTDGMTVWFKTPGNNTAAVTIDVNELGAVSIVDSAGGTLVANTLLTDKIYGVRYNSSMSKFQLVSMSGIHATYADLARRWAEEDEDVDVDGGFSSKHYSLKTAAQLDTKANKVGGSPNGNFAGLDADGDLTDTGRAVTELPTYAASGETAFSLGAAVTWAHGLGSTPTRFCAVFRCKTADAGFSVGDEVMVAAPIMLSGTYSLLVYADSTNVGLAINGASMGFQEKTGVTGVATITPANWKIVFRAWAD